MSTDNHSQTGNFLWSIADLLRGDFKQSQYGRIILPFTLLRRMECVLEATKDKVLAAATTHQDKPDLVREKLLLRAAAQQFFNASPLSLGSLSDTQTDEDLINYVQSFSTDAREIFDYFRFEEFVQQLAAGNLLYQVVQQFAKVDLSPERISNAGMGSVFEYLIRQFAESSNETAGEHFTPRDIVQLTTSLLFLLHLVSKMREPKEGGSRIGIILNGSPLFTGGAGSGESEIRRCLLQNDLVEAIVALPTDMFYNTGIATYVWVLSNCKPQKRQGKVQLIDGSQHFSKMRKSLGSKRQFLSDDQIDALVRLYGRFEETEPDAKVQSKIFPVEAFGYRRITVERPLRLAFQVTAERVEAVLGLKAILKLSEEEQGQLRAALASMDAETVHLNREAFTKLLKQVLKAAEVALTGPQLKAVLKELGESRAEADLCLNKKGEPEPDSGLRDYENVPLGESVEVYFEREVLPHVPEAWIDRGKRDAIDGEVGVVGFEIPFNRHFYVFEPPRELDEIDKDLKACTDRIKQMIEELSA